MKPEDQQRLDDVHAMPCICCKIEGVAQPFRTEAHHIVDKGYRKHSGGHQASIPLDSWHHRGRCLDGMTTSEMLYKYGPSLDLHKKRFIEAYGTERELLAEVNK